MKEVTNQPEATVEARNREDSRGGMLKEEEQTLSTKLKAHLQTPLKQTCLSTYADFLPAFSCAFLY